MCQNLVKAEKQIQKKIFNFIFSIFQFSIFLSALYNMYYVLQQPNSLVTGKTFF